MAKEHVLEAIEPDNLLGFFALLGFLRALEETRPDWRPRVAWRGIPLRPHLYLAEDIGRGELLQAAADGCATLAGVHSFDSADLNYAKEEAREQLLAACDAGPGGRLRLELLSALMSDAAYKEDGTIRATPLCAMFGQGHQHFLTRLATVPKGIPPKELDKQISQSDLNSAAKLERALFVAWDRQDRTQSFRWDPLEDRRYALRFGDPSKDKGLTVHGANRLASIALPLITAVPKRERGEIRLYALGTQWDPGVGICLSWPVWSRGGKPTRSR